MTDQVVDQVEEVVVDTEEVSAADLQQQLLAAKAELAKQQAIKNQVIKDRDALKARLKDVPVDEKNTDYKALYAEQLKINEQVILKQKKADLENTLRSKLIDSGVADTKVNAALKLVDTKMIDSDVEQDETGIEAAIMVLRKDFDFLFEKKVQTTSVKQAAVTGKATQSEKTLTRAEWDNTPLLDRPALLQSGYKIID